MEEIKESTYKRKLMLYSSIYERLKKKYKMTFRKCDKNYFGKKMNYTLEVKKTYAMGACH